MKIKMKNWLCDFFLLVRSIVIPDRTQIAVVDLKMGLKDSTYLKPSVSNSAEAQTVADGISVGANDNMSVYSGNVDSVSITTYTCTM